MSFQQNSCSFCLKGFIFIFFFIFVFSKVLFWSKPRPFRAAVSPLLGSGDQDRCERNSIMKSKESMVDVRDKDPEFRAGLCFKTTFQQSSTHHLKMDGVRERSRKLTGRRTIMRKAAMIPTEALMTCWDPQLRRSSSSWELCKSDMEAGRQLLLRESPVYNFYNSFYNFPQSHRGHSSLMEDCAPARWE